jgi:two-component system sensor histidine kinase HydH
MQLGVGAGEDSSLARRLTWLTALRLVVLTVFLGITQRFYFRDVGFGGFSGQVALVTIGVAFVLAAAYAAVLRRGRPLAIVAHAQLVTDQVIWTALVYISGGVTSGASSLYGLTCLSGAIMLYRMGALTAAIAGITSYVLLCIGFGSHLLQPPVDQAADAYVTALEDMVYPAFSAIMTTGVVALLGAYLADRLRTFGGRLQVATARAEQAERLAAMGRLAAALAHEIRNPLGSIRGSIELLRTGGKLDPEDVRLCEIVEREVARLDGLVGDMMHLAKPREPAKAEMDLAATAASVVELARGSPRGAEVQVRYDGPPTLQVVADAAQMRQLLWNLVRNAMQSSPLGQEVVVRLSATSKGDARLEVLDRGPGISDEAREKIFDAFYSTRAHGMGLAVVKQVAEAHDFPVEIASGLETGGTSIALRIPAASRVAAVALALFGLGGCSSTRSWLEPGPSVPAGAGSQDDGWDDGSQRASQPDGGAVTADAPGSDEAADVDAGTTGGPLEIRLEGKGSTPRKGGAAVPGPSALASDPGATFRNTYYDFPQETAAAPGAPTETLFDPGCKPIQKVNKVFHDQLCVQGSGKIATGRTVSFAKRDCSCAATCPRTGQKICFEALDPGRFPWGRGALGTPIRPLVTVAVDPGVIPLGTVLYIPEYHGLRDLEGRAHDGCFVAEDRGLRVVGKHIDVYTGSPNVTRVWNAAVPSNQGVHVVLDPSRCAGLRQP